jgi:hypothetical protein
LNYGTFFFVISLLHCNSGNYAGKDNGCYFRALEQGCQIFLGTLYQNRKKCTKWTQNVPNGHKTSPVSVKCSKWT